MPDANATLQALRTYAQTLRSSVAPHRRGAEAVPAVPKGAPRRDAAGKVINLLWTVRDVSKAEAAQRRALQAERLAAVGQMVSGLSHEGRNALQRSQACLEMLMLELRDQPSALNLVDRVQKAQNHLLMLYEEVQAYAAPVRLSPKTCHLGELVGEA